MKFGAVADQYRALWAAMEIRPEKRGIARASAENILAGRARYEGIERAYGIPWVIVGLLHKMECNCKFDRHLHNGDPLTARTKLIPKNRPAKGSPPFTWEESAADALTMPGKRYDKITDWHDIARIAWICENYNGWGYRGKGINSPYLWSFSNHYVIGKYVRDREYDPRAVSSQVGTMVTLRALQEIAPDALAFLLKSSDTPIAVPDDDEDEILGVTEPPPAPDRKPVKDGAAGAVATGAGFSLLQPWTWPWGEWLSHLGCSSGIECASAFGSHATTPWGIVSIAMIVAAFWMAGRAKA